MTDLQMITQVSPDQLEDFARAMAQVTGQPFSLEQSMVGMTDHDENRATKVVFHAYEIPDIISGINRALEAFEDLQRLPDSPESLTSEHKQQLLYFAGSLAWNQYSVESGLNWGWERELPGVPMINVYATAFTNRRKAWIAEANAEMSHTGPETLMLPAGETEHRYSFLGTGLSAMEHNHPLHVDWSEPNQGDGFLWWGVDDTTVTLANHYAVHTQVIDDLDAMNRSGATVQAMGEYLNRQPILPESRGEGRPYTQPPTATPKTNGQRNGQTPMSPKPETIAQMATAVAAHLTTSTEKKSHGSWNFYEDDRIQISQDTYVANISVKINVDGQWKDVYSAGYHNHAKPNQYNRGNWTQYLQALAEQASEARALKEKEEAERDRADHTRRFGKIDDAAVFPDTPRS